MDSVSLGESGRLGFFRIFIKMGYPLVWYIDDITWQRRGPIFLGPTPMDTRFRWKEKADEILVDDLLVDIAYHTFATLGVIGIFFIESKKSELRLCSPVPNNSR